MTQRGKRLVTATVAALTLFGSIGISVWAILGWTITSATGVTSAMQTWDIKMMLALGIGGVVIRTLRSLRNSYQPPHQG